MRIRSPCNRAVPRRLMGTRFPWTDTRTVSIRPTLIVPERMARSCSARCWTAFYGQGKDTCLVAVDLEDCGGDLPVLGGLTALDRLPLERERHGAAQLLEEAAVPGTLR